MKSRITLVLSDGVKAFIGFVVFILLIAKVFCNTTYLFRNIGYNREHIVGIKNENVDMIYIGGSAAFIYWQPLKAWNDCGFTSYSYATDTIQAEAIKAYIKEVRTTLDPELYVVGVRAFQYYSDEQEEQGLRNSTDNMDLTSFARYELLHDYFSHRTIADDTDILSYYFDIAKYHTNWGDLDTKPAWGYINNNGISPNKGWLWVDKYGYLEEPQGFITDQRAKLLEDNEKILVDLLDYCKEEELNVLFVVCPYYLTKEEQEIYNIVGDIIKSYGFDYLNANEYYDEIGIDFTVDFYNKDHVNLFGAAKYTEFLENYILINYDMPDHRGDANYSSWDEDYLRFADEETEHTATVTNLRLEWEKGLQYADEMRKTQNLSEWHNLVDDVRFDILIAVGDNAIWPQSVLEQKIMESLGLKEGGRRQIRVISQSEIIYSNEHDIDESTDDEISLWEYGSYCISVEDGVGSILINDKESSFNQADVNIVVVDNNYKTVVDSVVLRCEDDGTVHIYR